MPVEPYAGSCMRKTSQSIDHAGSEAGVATHLSAHVGLIEVEGLVGGQLRLVMIWRGLLRIGLGASRDCARPAILDWVT